MLVKTGPNQWAPYRAKRFTEGSWKFPYRTYEILTNNLDEQVPKIIYEDPIDLSLLSHWWWLLTGTTDPLQMDDTGDLTASAGVTFPTSAPFGANLPLNEYLAGTVTLPDTFTLAGRLRLGAETGYFNLLTDIDVEKNFTIRTLYPGCVEGVDYGVAIYVAGALVATFDLFASTADSEFPFIITVAPTEITLTFGEITASATVALTAFPMTMNVKIGTVDAYGGVALGAPEGNQGQIRSLRIYNGLLTAENTTLLSRLLAA